MKLSQRQYHHATNLASLIRGNPKYTSHRPVNLYAILSDLGFKILSKDMKSDKRMTYSLSKKVITFNSKTVEKILPNDFFEVSKVVYKYLKKNPNEQYKLI